MPCALIYEESLTLMLIHSPRGGTGCSYLMIAEPGHWFCLAYPQSLIAALLRRLFEMLGHLDKALM